MKDTITKMELAKLKLRGKPKCPHCNIPLTYVYEGAYGFTGEKCMRCHKSFLVNTETLEVVRVLEEVS